MCWPWVAWPTPPNPRYGHTASISGPDIVFFGGWTYESGKRIDNSVSGNTEYFTILNTNTKNFPTLNKINRLIINIT